MNSVAALDAVMRDKTLRLESQKVEFCEDALAAEQIGGDQIQIEFARAKCDVAQDLAQEFELRFDIDLAALIGPLAARDGYATAAAPGLKCA